MAAALGGDERLALLGLWADTQQVHALFLDERAMAPLPASVPVVEGAFAALSPARPAAAWFERTIHDLWGHRAEGGTDLRPWIDHGRWEVTRPMAPRPVPARGTPEPPEFLPVEGEDLNQVPVGPIHAGIIEPGHFRFTCQGETVVRLEVRLGYAHKGQMVLMRGKPPRVAARYAARLSGDSTVAHSIAFARAVEAAVDVAAPPRAEHLRAVMLEMERVANHLGDVGAICNDAAFALALARFGLHREAMLRAGQAAFGHRLMMDAVVPGGVAVDLAEGGAKAILSALAAACAELPALQRTYDDHAGLVDRMVGTGVVSPALVRRFAAGGVVGRASGRGFDARSLMLPATAEGAGAAARPLEALRLEVPVLQEGDVDARVRIRLAEIEESARLLRELLATVPEGKLTVALPPGSGEGIGVAEGFRGDIWHWLRLDGGLVAACYPRDPSWLHWPLLEAAMRGNILADFPLCNKSFNASYSGVDL
ncbi:MAG TPA: nickel-dependent hydrogenase large subunit [Acetobacteraceae bacterium]|nr:nickel-dependent hydrogenase large subunit [Acetobacteraceae bacterium]